MDTMQAAPKDDPFRRRLEERYLQACKEYNRARDDKTQLRMRLEACDRDPTPPGTSQRGRQAA